MKHIKKLSMLMIVVLAVAICGCFPSEVFAGKVLKGTLAGVVVDQNGKPVSNTQVYVYQRDWSNTDGMGIPDWKTLAGTTVTGRNGQYKIALPAGEYRVMFVPSNLDLYAMEAYPDAPIARLGDSITIRYGKTTGGISAKLDPSGKVGGYLYDTYPGREGQPLPNTPMAIGHQESSYINCFQFVSTDANGYYEFKGLKPYPWLMWANCPIVAAPGDTEPTPVPNYRSDYKDYFLSLTGKYSWMPAAGQTFEREGLFLEYNEFVNITGTLFYYDEIAQTNKPVVGMTVRADFADDPTYIQDWGGDSLEAVTDSTGKFEMRGFYQEYGLFVLRVEGIIEDTQVFYDEYYDNSQEPCVAQEFELFIGTTTQTGEWMLEKIPEGQNP